MKSLVLFFVSVLIVFMSSCQKTGEMPDYYDISKLGIDMKDAKRTLSHKPTSEVYVKTIKIDFGLNQTMENCIKVLDQMIIFRIDPSEMSITKIFEGNIYAIPTLGKLVDIYQKGQMRFESYISSSIYPPSDGNYILPKLEYSLAQECLRDAYSSITRKTVLQMAIDKQKTLSSMVGISNYNAIRTNIFLMAVILVKEKDAAFIAAVGDNQDLQNAMSLNYDIFNYRKLSDDISQFAINFLSNQ